MSDTTELKIEFEDEKICKNFTNAVLHEIELKEEISSPFLLVGDLLLPTPLPKNTLRDILGKKTKITITAKLTSSESKTSNYATRYVKGVVTKIRYEGIIYSDESSTNKQQCARYRLTVEPFLALLSKTRRTRTFRQKSPHEVIVSILNEYKIRADVQLVENDNDQKQFFQQQGESDLDFIHRLMRLYGLNYNFIHKYEGWDPDFIITNKWLFEPGNVEASSSNKVSSKVTYTTGKKDALLLQGSVTTKDDNKIYIRNWTMEEFFSTQEVNVGLDDEKTSSETPISWTMGDGLNQYQTYFGKSPLKYDRYRLSRLLKASSDRRSSIWRGNTDSLSISSGSLVQLQGLFGNDNDSLTILTIKTELFVRGPWPNDLAYPPGEELEAKPLTISIKATERIEDEDCGSFAPLSKEQDKLYVPQAASIYCGVVTAGSIENNSSEDSVAQQFPTDVFVKIEGISKPVTALVTLASGGAGSSFRYFPRVGDNVLIAGFGGRWFIVGYLPTLNAVDYPSELRNRIPYSSVWKGAASNVDYYLGEKAESNQISISSNVSSTDKALDLLLTGEVENYIKNQAYTTNKPELFELLETLITQGIPSSKDKRNSKGLDYKTTVNTYLATQKKVYELQQEQDNNVISDENTITRSETQQQALKNLQNSWGDLKEIASYLANQLWYKKEETGETSEVDKEKNKTKENFDSIKLCSVGDLVLSGNSKDGTIDLSAKSLRQSAAEVFVNGDDTITIQSPKKIQLTVGFNSLTIDTNGIILRSLKGATMPGGFLDSSVRLDSLTGVAINGITTSMTGCLKASVSDSLGGSFSASNGSSTTTGIACKIATTTPRTARDKTLAFVANVLTELTSIADSTTTGTQIVNSMPAFMINWSTIQDLLLQQIHKFQDTSLSTAPVDKITFGLQMIFSTLDLFTAIADLVVTDLIALQPGWMSTVNPSGMTNKDCIVLATTAEKFLNTLQTLLMVHIKLAKTSGAHHASTINLSSDKITLDTTMNVLTGRNTEVSANPLAGLSNT